MNNKKTPHTRWDVAMLIRIAALAISVISIIISLLK